MEIKLKITDDPMDEVLDNYEKIHASASKLTDSAFNSIMDFAREQASNGVDALSASTIYIMVLQAYQKEFKKLNPALLKTAIESAEVLMDFFDETLEKFKEEETRYTA